MVTHKKTFHLHGGKTFSSVKSLAKELKDMGKETFEHHVNIAKNDFADWLKNSLKEEKLAESLQKRVHKLEMELEVLRHLVHSPKKKVLKKISSKK